MHMPCHFTRRTFVRLLVAAGLLPFVNSRPTRAQAQVVAPAYSYPMGVPGGPLGDGLLVRHGYATENTWYNPGGQHNGEVQLVELIAHSRQRVHASRQLSKQALQSMGNRLTRRGIMRASLAATLTSRFTPAAAQSVPIVFSYPVGQPGRVLGDGFLIRHGYATENTWYLPGYLHAGEDWYTTEGDAAGASVYATAAGEVVFAGSDYPGRVVIVWHADALFSMYAHLDYALAVGVGDVVERGQPLGTILARTDGRAPSHLHFEIRTFLTTPEVNGDSPRYGFACGIDCPPGPGYWPIDAPEHPSVMGWRNPTHVIGGHTELSDGSEAVVTMTATGEVNVWTAPQPDNDAEPLRSLLLRPGDRYALLAIDAGPVASEGTSAEAYHLWYQIATPDGTAGWVQAALPSTNDSGSDGRPSSVRFQFLPAIVVGS